MKIRLGWFACIALLGLCSVLVGLGGPARAQVPGATLSIPLGSSAPVSAGAQFGDYKLTFNLDQVVPSGDVCQTTTTTAHTAKLPVRAQAPPDVPVKPKSIAVTQTSTSISVLYLIDSKGTSATAFTVPLYSFPGTSGKLKICTIGALSIGVPQTQIYAGAGLSYLLYSNSSGYSVTLFAGLKGFNVADGFQAASGAHQPVFGGGISIPIKNL